MDETSPEYRAIQQYRNKPYGGVMCCACQEPRNNEPACGCDMVNWFQVVDNNYYRISFWYDEDDYFDPENIQWRISAKLVGPVDFDYGTKRIEDIELYENGPRPPTLTERLIAFKAKKNGS